MPTFERTSSPRAMTLREGGKVGDLGVGYETAVLGRVQGTGSGALLGLGSPSQPLSYSGGMVVGKMLFLGVKTSFLGVGVEWVRS
eukprot:CAMPEP_0173106174 /NCGR_PEP_ID=MMETSP1102-20130122/40753_1 /TAXON_ID=49646 /ORGANISM="Geminigera sp., Strain Caron Lab Isolate" /LENGTH=84 /DNA_ID=CAMNT_0014002979 /DNA_START=505 /DNA_END=755 /DNA_ORIENTATION=-